MTFVTVGPVSALPGPQGHRASDATGEAHLRRDAIVQNEAG